MTQLAEIRGSLNSLAARRRRARVVDVLLLGAAGAAVALAAYYQLDRRFTLSVPSRLFLDVVLAATIGWFVVRKLFPALLHRDDPIETALRFERRRGIDADLVAALQFEPYVEHGGEETTSYGSRRLAGAVVDDVADAGRDWNFQDEPVEAAPRRRRLALVVVVAMVVASAIVYPRHAGVFFERVLLASPHYPSNTQIDELIVGGRKIDLKSPGASPLVVPLGRPVVFELHTSGTEPESAVVELMSPTGGAASLELAPVDGSRTRFRAVLPAVIEDAEGRAVAGDDYTETFHLRATALPAVTVTLDVRPPAYAAEASLDVPPPGRLYAAVLEGSAVGVRVDGANKPLARVVLTVGEKELGLSPDAEKKTWRLSSAGTDFATVKKPIEFAIDVVDTDGFGLPTPLRGSIALRPDQPPSVAADVVTKFVLPTGKPSIFYQASDDLGVESLAVERQVQRVDGTATSDTVPIPLAPEMSRTAPAGKFPLELSSLELHKGDKVTIRLTARDRRGADPRAVAQSEPFVLEVTDEQGLYEAMAETDQRSALKMDEIIQKQLMMTAPGTGRLAPTVPRPTATAAPAPAVTPSSTKP